MSLGVPIGIDDVRRAQFSIGNGLLSDDSASDVLASIMEDGKDPVEYLKYLRLKPGVDADRVLSLAKMKYGVRIKEWKWIAENEKMSDETRERARRHLSVSSKRHNDAKPSDPFLARPVRAFRQWLHDLSAATRPLESVGTFKSCVSENTEKHQ